MRQPMFEVQSPEIAPAVQDGLKITLSYIQDQTGIYFDSEVIDVFFKLMADQSLTLHL
jgi:hypothetical protein